MALPHPALDQAVADIPKLSRHVAIFCGKYVRKTGRPRPNPFLLRHLLQLDVDGMNETKIANSYALSLGLCLDLRDQEIAHLETYDWSLQSPKFPRALCYQLPFNAGIYRTILRPSEQEYLIKILRVRNLPELDQFSWEQLMAQPTEPSSRLMMVLSQLRRAGYTLKREEQLKFRAPPNSEYCFLLPDQVAKTSLLLAEAMKKRAILTGDHFIWELWQPVFNKSPAPSAALHRFLPWLQSLLRAGLLTVDDIIFDWSLLPPELREKLESAFNKLQGLSWQEFHQALTSTRTTTFPPKCPIFSAFD